MSTVPAVLVADSLAYLVEGGPANLVQLARFLTAALRSLKGAAFDRAFLTAVRDEHIAEIAKVNGWYADKATSDANNTLLSTPGNNPSGSGRARDQYNRHLDKTVSSTWQPHAPSGATATVASCP